MIVDNLIRIKESDAKPLLKILESKFTYLNPAYFKLKAMGLYVSEKTKYIKTYNIKNGVILLPRGAIGTLKEMFRSYKVEYTLVDNRIAIDADIRYLSDDNSDLSNIQAGAAIDLAKHSQGLLLAPPAAGKTRTMLKMLSIIKQKTLVIVHTSEIFKHWKQEIIDNTNIKDIGLIGMGKKTLGTITLAMIQTLNNLDEDEWRDINKTFGCIVLSEVHHCPAETYFKTINKFKAKYRYGETASKTRKDEKEFLMYDSISHKVVEIEEDKLQNIKRSMPVEVSSIYLPYVNDQSEEWTDILKKVVTNEERNWYIIREVERDVNAGHKVLIMTERKQHCHDLQQMLASTGIKSIVLISDVEYEERKKLIKSLTSDDTNVIIATVKLIAEGANIPILSCLHLVTPSNNFEMTKQKVGRIRRICEGKLDPIVKDYVDYKCEFLERMAKNRAKHYRKLGFPITVIKEL